MSTIPDKHDLFMPGIHNSNSSGTSSNSKASKSFGGINTLTSDFWFLTSFHHTTTIYSFKKAQKGKYDAKHHPIATERTGN